MSVSAGSSSGTFGGWKNLATTNTHDASAYPTRMSVGDITGDGKLDFIAEWTGYTKMETVYTYAGLSTGKFNTFVGTATNVSYYFQR